MNPETDNTLSPNLLAEINSLHFITRKTATASLLGDYRSAFRGQGMEFEEVREYIPGDDTRSIDWKVTARMRKPFIKSFREERELSVLLLVDVSASTNTGTKDLRKNISGKIAALLALVALNSNDKIGLITYSDQLHKFHKPKKSRSAVWRIIHEILKPQKFTRKTNLAEMLSFTRRVLKSRTIVFVISDFQDLDFEQELSITARKHDINIISLRDPADIELNLNSLVSLKDPETGENTLLDFSNKQLKESYRTQALLHQKKLEMIFKHSKVDVLKVSTNSDISKLLGTFLRNKARRV